MIDNEKIYLELQALSGKIAQISEALLGNPMRKGDEGISGAVVDHEARIKIIEDKLNLAKYFFMGIGMVGGAVGSLIFYFIRKFIYK